jgi:hypothetical protein
MGSQRTWKKELIMRKTWLKRSLAAAAMVAVSGWVGLALAGSSQVNLTGSQEVPAVNTSASGNGSITVNDDKTVSGTITTNGITGTAAHIHAGAPGKNGGVAVPLTKGGDNTWTVPPGTKLTDQQYKAYKAGDLYVNVHSAAHPSGEIRDQLKPQG